jgi:acid stress-induced BolA-like protein IbaG/YrbA
MIVDQIRSTILKAIPDAEVLVTDPMNDGQHFQAVVISPEFEGLSLIKQHQMVMKPLTQAFATNVHALGLKTFSPSQWEKQ